MNYLLDTHILIWALENNSALSQKARDVIIDGANVIYVSTASVWEISIKQAIGKLTVPDNLLDELEIHRFTLLNITYEHAELAGQLPFLHRDPLDQMLIAQAKVEKLTLISNEGYF